MQSSPNDLDRILAFAQQVPDATFHSVDLPYRLCSPAAQEPANRRVWTDATGEVVGFGITQLPFSTLDWAVRPGYKSLYPEIVTWGIAHLEEVARQRGEGFGYLLDSRRQDDQVALRNGFELDDWCIRNLAIELAQPPQPTPVPDGFKIRPLRGDAEVAAYVELHRSAFGSRNMTIEWRARLPPPRVGPRNPQRIVTALLPCGCKTRSH